MSESAAEMVAERFEAKKNRSQRPTGEDRMEAKKERSQRPRNTPEDRKEAKATLDAQRAEALDETGLFTGYYGEEGEELEFTFDPENFNVEFQLIAESGRIATALQYVIGADQMKQLYKYDPKELQEVISSLAKQCGRGNS